VCEILLQNIRETIPRRTEEEKAVTEEGEEAGPQKPTFDLHSDF